MAVDFSLLPPEEPFVGTPPSKLVWGIVFVVTVLLGVAAVLLLWPRSVPTHTWKFWTSLVIFPVGISGFVVLRRFSRYEAPVLDVGLHNAAVRAFNERVFRAASIPLALVGAVHRFSARPDENAAASIQKGILTLKTRVSIARDEEPVRARWLNTPGMQTTPGNLSDDLDRSRQVTAWLLDELVTELLPRIRKLPLGMPLRVRLQITNGLPPEENTQLWETCCRTKPLRGVVVVQGAERPGDLIELDRWLDATLEGREVQATLFVAIQLHPLLAASPPSGAAEAGAAILLLPDSLARKHGVVRDAILHRPVRGLMERVAEPLSTALRWAGVSAKQISGAWQTGLDPTQAGALRETGIKMGLVVRATDLDQSIGHAGIAAPWLALACASALLAEDAPVQTVSVGQEGRIDCIVLKSVSTARSKSEDQTAQEAE